MTFCETTFFFNIYIYQISFISLSWKVHIFLVNGVGGGLTRQISLYYILLANRGVGGWSGHIRQDRFSPPPHVSLWWIQLTTSIECHPFIITLSIQSGQRFKKLTVNLIIFAIYYGNRLWVFSQDRFSPHTHMFHHQYNWPRHHYPFITASSIQSGPRFKTLTINLIIFYLLTATMIPSLIEILTT